MHCQPQRNVQIHFDPTSKDTENMSTQRYTSTATPASTILEQVKSGALIFGDFQRPYCWDASQAYGLLRSLVPGSAAWASDCVGA